MGVNAVQPVLQHQCPVLIHNNAAYQLTLVRKLHCSHCVAGSTAAVISTTHPQMLRLDQLVLHDQQPSAETQDPAGAAGQSKANILARKAKLPPFSGQLKADERLLDMEWQGVEGGLYLRPPPALLLDLNDPQMTFEVLRGTDADEYANAAATILPALPKVRAPWQHGSQAKPPPPPPGRLDCSAACCVNAVQTSLVMRLCC